MIKRMSKFFVLVFCASFVLGCSSSKIKNDDMLHSFTFGLLGHDAYKFCNDIDPTFIDPYKNGVNPSRTCINYQYYTCHINHYCKGDKVCEKEAAQYWTPIWQGTENDLKKRVQITKKSCNAEAKDCNSGLKNDTRCKNLSSEKYKEILKKEKQSKAKNF